MKLTENERLNLFAKKHKVKNINQLKFAFRFVNRLKQIVAESFDSKSQYNSNKAPFITLVRDVVIDDNHIKNILDVGNVDSKNPECINDFKELQVEEEKNKTDLFI